MWTTLSFDIIYESNNMPQLGGAKIREMLLSMLQRVRKESLSPTPIAGTPHLCDKSISTAIV
jgi:hypothetical protein